MSPALDLEKLPPLANAIRALAMDAVEAAQSGHPGMPMGMADVATVLYARHLRFCAGTPTWPNRDRVVLSAGHGSMLLYATAYLTGYKSITLEDIKKFRQLGSITPGHPEHHVDIGVETTTGPLGQGLGNAVGFALAQRLTAARYGEDLFNHYTYVIAGDGDMQEGVTHEAAALAGHWGLNKLVILYDDNGISIDGPTSLSFTEDVCARYQAYGFVTHRIDGHDYQAIDDALTWAKTQDRPVLIACKTTIGFGAGVKAGTADAHGSPLGVDEIAIARKNLNWPHSPFVIPDEILTSWRKIGARCLDDVGAWEKALQALPEATRYDWTTSRRSGDQNQIKKAIDSARAVVTAETKPIATRKASQMVLEHLVPAMSNLIGGSADLTGSNLTKVKGHSVIPANAGIPSALGAPAGVYPRTTRSVDPGAGATLSSPYIYYGVREHGMAAIMNGLALYGGFIPYGGTFLCFADYMRPAIRLAALMRQQVIYVMTHDSIGLGEDGPTHQPIEHLASLRAIPNVLVLRPVDAADTAACWARALSNRHGPTILCLSRQAVPPLPAITYDGTPHVAIYATGSEASLAVEVAAHLSKGGTNTWVYPLANLDDAADIRKKLPSGILHVGIEAGVRQGWDSIIGSDGLFFGLDDFGASGKYQDIYTQRGLDKLQIAQAITAYLQTP
jgi:transketolase